MADGAGEVKALLLCCCAPTGGRAESLAPFCRLLLAAALVALLVAVEARQAGARSLEQALASTFPGVLREDGAGLALVFARTVAASFPVTGASASYTYRFDPATDAFRRRRTPHGPVFSERAETVGAGKLSVALNYVFADYDSINGRDLDGLVSNAPSAAGDYIAICVTSPCTPLRGVVRLDLEAQIVGLSATYGISPDLDVNLSVPLVRTSLRAATSLLGPDPRAAPRPEYSAFSFEARAGEDSTGIGDVLLRLKRVLRRHQLADLAAGVTLALPSGERADFHGTGDTVIGAALFASRPLAERVEPHVNLGFALNADKFARSQAHYSLGADGRLLDWLTVSADFLGRSGVARADRIERPVFVQLERADVLQLATGVKLAPGGGAVLRLDVLVPLNDDGVRAARILAAGLEWVF